MKKLVSYILAFILSVFLIVFIMLELVGNTVLKKEYVLDKIEEINYYEDMHQDLVTEIDDYVEQSGLDEFNIKEIFTEERIKEDVNSFIGWVYNENSLENIKSDLKLEIENKLEDSNISLTQEEKKEAEDAINNLVSNYATIVLYDAFVGLIRDIPKLIIIVNKLIVPAKIVIGVCIGIILGILLLLNKFKGFLKYLGVALLTLGIILVGIKIWFNLGVDLANLFILNKAISNLLRVILNDILKTLNFRGIISIFGGIVLTIISACQFRNN